MTLQNMLKMRAAWTRPAGPHHAVVLSSRVRLARNLLGQPFNSRAGARALSAVLEAAFAACRRTKVLGKGAYLRLDELEPVELAFLAERRLASPHLASEPRHRGVVVGDAEVLSLMVNEEDHLRLQAIDSGLCLAALWERADGLDTELARSLEFAFHPRWGYLTACPTNAGTGMRVSALLHLPGLTLSGRLNTVLEGLSRLGMVVRGLHGEGTRVLGDFYQVANGAALGRPEADLAAIVSRGVHHLVQMELEAQRSVAAAGRKTRLEDLVYRSFGVLSNARVISFEEAMGHLSYLRLALSLGWKVPADFETANDLMLLAQPAHLRMLAGREAGAGDADFLRATLLRRRLSGK